MENKNVKNKDEYAIIRIQWYNYWQEVLFEGTKKECLNALMFTEKDYEGYIYREQLNARYNDGYCYYKIVPKNELGERNRKGEILSWEKCDFRIKK